jgi:serine protease Do
MHFDCHNGLLKIDERCDMRAKLHRLSIGLRIHAPLLASSAFLSVLVLISSSLRAEPNPELAFRLKASVAKVHVITKTGGHGIGTGVVVGKNLVATNCHVLANATGVNITKFGDSFAPVAVKADWAHDLCILRFEFLDLTPVELGDSTQLQYEQDIFSIGFPGGPPKPITTYGKIKALYPFDDASIIRTDASFVMGASGSPIFDSTGKLIGISTFKSPGRLAFFYNIPVQWVKALLNAPETSSLISNGSPFWDAVEAERPFFMRVVLPYQNAKWADLNTVAQAWLSKEPTSPEALFYAGVAAQRLGDNTLANRYFQQVLTLQPQHSATLMELGLMAKQAGKTADVEKTRLALRAINRDLEAEFDAALNPEADATSSQTQ